MKHLLILLSALALMTFSGTAHAQTDIGGKLDSARGNATFKQTTPVGSIGGLSVEVDLKHATDTITGYISFWCSLSGNAADYAPYPGADSIAIAAVGDIHRVVILSTPAGGNPIKFLQIRTRCASNTTNATSKAHIRSRLNVYK